MITIMVIFILVVPSVIAFGAAQFANTNELGMRTRSALKKVSVFALAAGAYGLWISIENETGVDLSTSLIFCAWAVSMASTLAWMTYQTTKNICC